MSEGENPLSKNPFLRKVSSGIPLRPEGKEWMLAVGVLAVAWELGEIRRLLEREVRPEADPSEPPSLR